jgi:hypothetical protein
LDIEVSFVEGLNWYQRLKPELVARNLGSAGNVAGRGSVANVAGTAPITALYNRLGPAARCCRPRFPLLENAKTRRSGCRGAIAAHLIEVGIFLASRVSFLQAGFYFAGNCANSGSLWTILLSN